MALWLRGRNCSSERTGDNGGVFRDVLHIAGTVQVGNAMFLSKTPFHAGSSDVTDLGNADKLAFATHPKKKWLLYPFTRKWQGSEVLRG
jgi:hypothetical protein